MKILAKIRCAKPTHYRNQWSRKRLQASHILPSCSARCILTIFSKDTILILNKGSFIHTMLHSISSKTFFIFQFVLACGCSSRGASDTVCNTLGECTCLDGYTGQKCDRCTNSSMNYSREAGCQSKWLT